MTGNATLEDDGAGQAQPDAGPDAGPEQGAQSQRGPSRRYLWFKYLLGLPLGLMGLLALAFVALDTRIGHRVLADAIADYETKTGLRVVIGRINGSIYGRASLEDVTLLDPEGVFLRVPAAQLDWRPLNWFGSGLDIRQLALKRGTLQRLPRLRPGDPDSPLLPDFDIRIDRLVVERLTIAPAVLGSERRVDFRASALIRGDRVHVVLGGKLGGGDRLAVLLDAERARNRFDLGLDYAAPKGGLLAALTGAKADRRVRLSGKGSWTDWRGGLLADQGGARLAVLSLTHRAGQLGLAGKLWSDPLVPAKLRGAIGPQVAVVAHGTLAKGVLAGSASAVSNHWQVRAQGGANLTANRFDDLVVTAQSRGEVPALGDARLMGASGKLALGGNFGTARATWSLAADRFVSGKISLTGLAAKGTARRELFAATPARWHIPAEVSLARIITGKPALDPQLIGTKARGTLFWSAGRLAGDNLVLDLPRLAARLALRADAAGGGYALAGRANLRSWPVPSVGATSGEGTLVLSLPTGGGWSISAKLAGSVPQVDNAALAQLVGGSARFSGEATAGSGKPMLISRASLNSPLLQLGLSGRMTGDGRAELTGSGRHSAYGAFTGAAQLAADGPHAALHFVDPFPAGGVKDVDLALDPSGADYRLTAAGSSLLGPFNGNMLLTVPPQGGARLQVEHLVLSNTRVTGMVMLASGGASGTLQIGGGGVAGNIVLAQRSGGLGVDVALAIDGAKFSGEVPLSIGRGRLEASGLLVKNHTTITGSMVAQGIGQGRLFIGKAAANVRLQDGVGQITASFGGRRGSRFDLQTMLDVAPGRFAMIANGVFAGQPISMPRRAVFTRRGSAEGGGWQLAPSEVDFGGGRTIASGMFGTGAMEVRLGLSSMPLSLADVVFVNLGLGGRVSGMLTYSKQRENLPEGQAQLMIKGLSRSGLVLTSRPVDLALVGRLDAGALEMRAVASEGGQTRGRLQARIDRLGRSGGLSERLQAGALQAQMRYAGPADALWRLMAIETFDLTGPLELAADVGGSIADPRIRGSLAGTALRLQSAQTGTDISQIAASGSFDGAQLSLNALSGQTTGGGQVTGSGRLDFANMGKGRGPAIDLRLAAHHAQLLSRMELGLMASGPLRVVSDGMGGTIAGRLVIDRARWRLGQAATIAALPNIATSEVNRGADVAPASVRDKPWRFMVDAAGPGRIQVDGLGLTSEWSADVKLRGTLDAPAIAGRADLVAGTYEFAGRRFDLKRGRISFDGGSPPDPRLDILATADVSGLAASVTVRGTSLRPEIGFASVPALPEEELLSRLLFGDSITKISAPEALQLGSALASLHGGGGLDPINKLRSAIGLDRLRIVSADAALGRQTGVAVGKYLGRRFYAEIVTDGRGYSATNVEFRVTNWLALLASVSTIGRQSVNAKVTHDY